MCPDPVLVSTCRVVGRGTRPSRAGTVATEGGSLLKTFVFPGHVADVQELGSGAAGLSLLFPDPSELLNLVT